MQFVSCIVVLCFTSVSTVAVVEHKPSAKQDHDHNPHHNGDDGNHHDLNPDVHPGSWHERALDAMGIKHHTDVHQHVQRDYADYHLDAVSFLKKYPDSGSLPCNLPRKTMAEAKDTWDSRAEAFSRNNTFPGPGGIHPWLPYTSIREPGEQSELEHMRASFAKNTFGGPGILEGTSEGWAAKDKWDADTLQKQLEGLHFGVETFSYPGWLDGAARPAETVAEYLGNKSSSHGFFLFLSEPVHMEPLKDELLRTVDNIAEDVQPHPFFAAAMQEHHAILAVDGIGSSHSFHRHASVWQTQVKGRKVWWLMPPNVTSDSRDKDGFVKYGSSPVVDGQTYTAPNACAFLEKRAPPPRAHICIQEPGEALLLPEDWWHATCAVDDFTVALGGWLMDQRHSEAQAQEEAEEDHNDEHGHDRHRNHHEHEKPKGALEQVAGETHLMRREMLESKSSPRL